MNRSWDVLTGTLISCRRYKNGRAHGQHQLWMSDVKWMSEENYNNGMYHGTQTWWISTRPITREYSNGRLIDT
jgi:antitoxin component YwqK of YwqJK toxin-antitoxin module